MITYKELFTDAKIEMDKRLKKQKIEEEEMIELGKSDAKNAFNNVNHDIDEFVNEELDHFLWCMHETDLKPPFFSVSEKPLLWKENFGNPYYMHGLKQGIKEIVEKNIKGKIPEFCKCTVNIKEKIKETYLPVISLTKHDLVLSFEFELDFNSKKA